MCFRRFIKYIFENGRNEKGTIILADIIPYTPFEYILNRYSESSGKISMRKISG